MKQVKRIGLREIHYDLLVEGKKEYILKSSSATPAPPWASPKSVFKKKHG